MKAYYINKNTQKLKKVIEGMGFTPKTTNKAKKASNKYIVVDPKEWTEMDKNGITILGMTLKSINSELIDCGKDEELFLTSISENKK